MTPIRVAGLAVKSLRAPPAPASRWGQGIDAVRGEPAGTDAAGFRRSVTRKPRAFGRGNRLTEPRCLGLEIQFGLEMQAFHINA
jgi:hypothetical protein